MKENQVSLTAMMSAYLRAYHSMYDNPKIFDDFLAYQLIPVERRLLIEQGLARSLQLHDPKLYSSSPELTVALARVMRAMTGPPNVLSRSRYTEDNLAKAIEQGVKQYVILGAGMDTFVFRHPELAKHLQVFEVDHSATQAFKCNRLTELKWELPKNLHFVPLDFTKDNLTLSLARSSYDPKVKTFFSWLGVTMYLTEDEVFNTLHNIANNAPAGTTVIFDYLDTDAFVPEKAAQRVQGMLILANHAGEPMKAGFDPTTLATDLAGRGLCLQENLSPADIEKRYFQERTDGYYACEHVHFARAVLE